MAAPADSEPAPAAGGSKAGSATPRSVELRGGGGSGGAARRALVGLASAAAAAAAGGLDAPQEAGEEQAEADERGALGGEALPQTQLEPATTARPGAVLDVSRPRGLRIPNRGAPASYEEPELDGLTGLPRGLAAELDHIRSACEKLLESMDDLEGDLMSASGRTASGARSPRAGASPRRRPAPRAEETRAAGSPRSSPARNATPTRRSLPATLREAAGAGAGAGDSTGSSPRRNKPRPSPASGRSQPPAASRAAGARAERKAPVAPRVRAVSPSTAPDSGAASASLATTATAPARRAGLFETAKRMA